MDKIKIGSKVGVCTIEGWFTGVISEIDNGEYKVELKDHPKYNSVTVTDEEWDFDMIRLIED